MICGHHLIIGSRLAIYNYCWTELGNRGRKVMSVLMILLYSLLIGLASLGTVFFVIFSATLPSVPWYIPNDLDDKPYWTHIFHFSCYPTTRLSSLRGIIRLTSISVMLRKIQDPY